MIKVALVDRQTLFREMLCNCINEWNDFEVVSAVSTGAEAAASLSHAIPDIVLMSIPLANEDSSDVISTLLEESATLRVVVLSESDSEADIFSAIVAGASGYLLRDTPQRRLRAQLRSVAQDGETVLSSCATTKLVELLRRTPGCWQASDTQSTGSSTTQTPSRHTQANRPHFLTNRETEILSLVAEGLSNREIADRLVVSEKTVKKHLNSVFAKLGVANRAQAAVYAIRTDLI